jgi:hypothetical protein
VSYSWRLVDNYLPAQAHAPDETATSRVKGRALRARFFPGDARAIRIEMEAAVEAEAITAFD